MKNIITNKNFLHGLMSLIISLISTTSFMIIAYTHYVQKNTLNDKSIQHAEVEIKEINKNIEGLKKENISLTIEQDKLFNNIHTLELKLLNLRNNLQNTINYQEVLRTEVKSLAENKLNTVDFWRLDDKVFIRLRWLEENFNLRALQH